MTLNFRPSVLWSLPWSLCRLALPSPTLSLAYYNKAQGLVSLPFVILQGPRFKMSREMSLYPHPRRVVTGHDENGHAVFVADSRVPCLPVAINCNFAVLYETHEFPVSNDGWEDPILKKTESLANHTGIVLRCVDFKPNTKTVSDLSDTDKDGFLLPSIEAADTFTILKMFHRTESLDFGLVFDGEVVWYVTSIAVARVNYSMQVYHIIANVSPTLQLLG